MRVGRGVGTGHCGLLGCPGRLRYHTRTPPEDGQDRRQARECYGDIGSEDRDAHGVEPEPPEQDRAAAKRENRYGELT